MKTIQIHPLSALVGAVSAAFVFALVSMASVQDGISQAEPVPMPVEGIPTYEDFLQIPAGKGYVVPEGKVFVAQGIGLVHGVGSNNEILFDKETVWKPSGSGVSSIPGPGLAAPAGTKVSVKVKGSFIAGYLADE